MGMVVLIGGKDAALLKLLSLSSFSPLRATPYERWLAAFFIREQTCGTSLIGAEEPYPTVVSVIIGSRTAPSDHHWLMD